MNDLIAWLRAQLDEIEFSDWHERTCRTHKKIASSSPLLAGQSLTCLCPVPEWLLADVASKRRILDEVVPEINAMDDRIEGEWGLGGDGPREETWLLLKLLALPFSDRPGYREDWRP